MVRFVFSWTKIVVYKCIQNWKLGDKSSVCNWVIFQMPTQNQLNVHCTLCKYTCIYGRELVRARETSAQNNKMKWMTNRAKTASSQSIWCKCGECLRLKRIQFKNGHLCIHSRIYMHIAHASIVHLLSSMFVQFHWVFRIRLEFTIRVHNFSFGWPNYKWPQNIWLKIIFPMCLMKQSKYNRIYWIMCKIGIQTDLTVRNCWLMIHNDT